VQVGSPRHAQACHIVVLKRSYMSINLGSLPGASARQSGATKEVSMHNLVRTIATAILLVAATTHQAAAGEDINFGILSTETSIVQKKNWEPLLAAMSKTTGLNIHGFYATDYAGVIEAMRFNKVQAAWYGNKSGMEASNRSGAEVFAQDVKRDGSSGYYSHIIVSADSPYTKLDDILKCDRSIDFGIGDPNSTSGFLVPIAYIFAPRNIDPKSCFKTVRNASHEANALAIANKLVVAATSNSISLRRLEQTSPDAHRKIKVIWVSPLIPDNPLMWRKDLDPAVKTKIYTFLMSYGRIGAPDELLAARTVLANLLWSPLLPASDDHLLPIRILEASKTIMKIKDDDKLPASDKAAKLAALEAEVKQYQEQSAKAENSAFRKRLAQFIEIDKTGDQNALKTLIAELAAMAASTPPVN
jgi:phosphonate transport system substrate-binding protein